MLSASDSSPPEASCNGLGMFLVQLRIALRQLIESAKSDGSRY
jgi:hypothetical protein